MKGNQLYSCKYGNEPADLKLMVVYFLKNIHYVLFSALAGLILAALSYYLFTFVLVEEHDYVATGELYLEYATDVRLDNVYINDYTWQGLVHTDKAVDFVMEKLSFTITEEELKASVTANLVSDVRFVTLKVTTTDPGRSVEIAQAYQEAIIHFADEMVDIERIVVFTDADTAREITADNKVVNMGLAGMAIGTFLSVFAILFFFTMDDSIHVPATFERRFGIPVIGIFHNKTNKELQRIDEGTTGKQPGEKKALGIINIQAAKNNLKVLARGCMDIAVTDISITPIGSVPFEMLLYLKLLIEQDEMTAVAIGDLAEADTQFSAPNFRMDQKSAFCEDANVAAECAKYDGTILLVRAGEHNTRMLESTINLFQKQECNIIGVLLYDADYRLLQFYYFTPISLKERPGATEKKDEE